MAFVPPWVASGSTLNSLLTHEYLLVTQYNLDTIVYYILLVAPLLIALRALGLGRVVRAALLTIVVSISAFLGLVSGARMQDEGPQLVLSPSGDQVMAEISGCLPGWLPEREVPNSCSGTGHIFSAESWKQWYAIADKVAEVARQRDCMYMSGNLANILACGADIPPTSLRTLVGFQTPHQLPSKRCQVTHSLYQLGTEKVMYQLPAKNFARGFREGSLPCMDKKTGQFTMTAVEEVWSEDLRAFEADHMHKK